LQLRDFSTLSPDEVIEVLEDHRAKDIVCFQVNYFKSSIFKNLLNWVTQKVIGNFDFADFKNIGRRMGSNPRPPSHPKSS